MLKSNIPIANIRFFDNTPTVADLERRFSRFLRGFRERKCVVQRIERAAEDGPEETFDLYGNSLSTADKFKIERRALRYVERQEAATGTGEPASFALIGSLRGWANARPGKVMETILRERCANPLMVVDEVEKAGDVTSEKGLRFSLTDALLPLLESNDSEDLAMPLLPR